MSDAEHFDAVIIGSGFGGSVCAHELALAGMKVCILERGKIYPPNSFARSWRDMAASMWDPSDGKYGMFNVWSFKGIEALIASGLGGGSLIYANVLLRMPPEWFANDYDGTPAAWPIRYEDLEPHYEAVEKMMGVQQYPYEDTPKTQAMEEAAAALAQSRDDVSLEKLNLAVTFANPGEDPVPGEPIKDDDNMHDRTRYTCRLCGECDIGCNYGSKNTLDYNYLTAAARHQADIRWLHEVRAFEPRSEGGYAIHYVKHNLADEGTPKDTGQMKPETMTADRLILSAGALGSPFLLLKNRTAFPRIGDALGSRFCGNGDLLTFALKCQEGPRDNDAPKPMKPYLGPVITRAIRVNDTLDGGHGRGFFVEDAGHPAFFTWLIEELNLKKLAYRMLSFAWGFMRRWLFGRRQSRDISRDVGALFGPGTFSDSSLPLLGMGRDVPDGKLYLDGKYLANTWEIGSSKDYFKRLRDTMADMADVWHAEKFVDNPTYRFNRVITVHPLGGCPMGESADTGVVDPYGEVHNYPGLYVADGSVMPGPVGANPALTIAAFARRCAHRILSTR